MDSSMPSNTWTVLHNQVMLMHPVPTVNHKMMSLLMTLAHLLLFHKTLVLLKTLITLIMKTIDQLKKP